MGYFQVRYDSRVVNYNRKGFIRLTTGVRIQFSKQINVKMIYLVYRAGIRTRKFLFVRLHLQPPGCPGFPPYKVVVAK